jgi:hypothetical protein
VDKFKDGQILQFKAQRRSRRQAAGYELAVLGEF